MKTRPSSESSMDSASSGDSSGDSTYAVRVEEQLLVKGGGFPHPRQTQAQGRRRRLVVVAVISLVLSVISLVAVLLIAAFVFFNNSDIILGGQQPQVAAGEEIIRRQQMIQKLTDILEPAGGQKIAKTTSSSAVSAHLLIQAGTGEGGLQQWKGPDASGLSHVRTGLTFHDNTIYVVTSGMYYVYCQMLYNRGDDNIDGVPQVVSSYVYRESLIDPVMSGIMLKTRHTRYSQQTDRHTSYVGGLVTLHKGDKLYVKVSEPLAVSNDEKGSFFGLFRVGE